MSDSEDPIELAKNVLNQTAHIYHWKGAAVTLAKAIFARNEGSQWIACANRLPEHDIICLISDGREIALATADRKFSRGVADVWWDSCGCGGHDFEFNFKPTHWKPMTITLP